LGKRGKKEEKANLHNQPNKPSNRIGKKREIGKGFRQIEGTGSRCMERTKRAEIVSDGLPVAYDSGSMGCVRVSWVLRSIAAAGISDIADDTVPRISAMHLPDKACFLIAGAGNHRPFAVFRWIV
jgi:hypothetical protein